MSWGKGQDVIEDLLTGEHLEQVPANPDEAQYLLGRARAHLDTAAREVEGRLTWAPRPSPQSLSSRPQDPLGRLWSPPSAACSA
jgi:hypothetical protein